MASIRIHQDIANFERKRKGFTTRQIVLLVCAVLVFIAVVALFYAAIGLALMWSVYIAIIPALFFVLAAFFKVADMHFEEFCRYLVAHFRRGRVVFYDPSPPRACPVSGHLGEDGVIAVEVADEEGEALDVTGDSRRSRGGDSREERKRAQEYAKFCRRAGFELERG